MFCECKGITVFLIIVSKIEISLQKLQEIVNNNNETISSLKKIGIVEDHGKKVRLSERFKDSFNS